MDSQRQWTEIMVSSLDRHFPWEGRSELPLPSDQMRLRFRDFAQEVDKQVDSAGNGRDMLEWRVTTTILRALSKRTKKMVCGRKANCLNAFDSRIDNFVWAVYKNSPAVREAVEIWCHHLGWRHIYMVSGVSGGSPRPGSEVRREGICLVGLQPRFGAIEFGGGPYVDHADGYKAECNQDQAA